MENDHIRELAQKQGQRIFIEQIFKEGKNLVGMRIIKSGDGTVFTIT